MYSIVFDTNCLQQGVGRDFSQPWIIKSLGSCCEIIEAMDAHDHFKFLIPEVVLRELRKHQLEKHKSSVDETRRLSLPSWSFEYDWDGYECFLDRGLDKLRAEKMLGLVPLEILQLPEASCMEKLVQRALEKRPPFSGSKSESDKGFKDALIWESLLEYKRNNLTDDIMLATGDGLLGSEKLQEEFRKEFNEDIIVVKNLTDLSEQIKVLISGMDLGYAVPEFAAEDSEIVEAVKSWLFENAEWLMDRCEVDYCADGRLKSTVELIEPYGEGMFQVSVRLQFECSPDDEIIMATVKLGVERDENEEWWLRSAKINESDWTRNELLRDW